MQRGGATMVFTESYVDNVAAADRHFRIRENFDILKKTLRIGERDELTLYFIDGFVKDAVMQKLMMHFSSLKELERGEGAAQSFADKNVPYVEVDIVCDTEQMTSMLLAGSTLVLGSTFGECAIIIDSRTYPARTTDEPESDKVLRGAHDGFVETLIFNTALVRRRIRDVSLRTVYKSVGRASRTDVVLMYMEGRADAEYVRYLTERLDSIDTDSITLGFQSLAETLIKTRWYNPFPKIRTTERPDVASAQLLEGSVILICDNSPEVMLLPTSIFDFMQQTDDYYLPPLTGGYLRILRHITFLLTLVLTPLWYLCITHPSIIPPSLEFIIPEAAKLSVIAQLLLAEFMVDGLKLASLNTPSVLSSSLGAIAGLILGEFAINIGFLSSHVVLLIAFSAIANFTQSSIELGFAFKFMRVFLLIMSWLFSFAGFFAGIGVIILLCASNKTVNGKYSYLYPLYPFNARAMGRLLVRRKK